jgi:WD40 repeat protein
VTPDGKKLYVSLQAEPYITVVNLETYEVKKLERTKTDYGAGTGSGLDMSNDGKYVAVSNTADDEVAIWDTATDQLVAKVKDIPKPVNVSFMGNTPYLATGNRNDGSISIVDTRTMKLLKTVKTGGGTNIPYVGPDGMWYTSQNGAGFLTVLDPQHEFRVTRNIWGVQNIHWLYWGPDGKTVFGTNWGDKTVSKVDMMKRKDFRTTLLVGLNPNGIAVKSNVPVEDLVKFREKSAAVKETLQKASTLVIPTARNEKEKAFLDTCLQCHDIGRILRSNTKGDAWAGTVNRMEGNGAKMTAEQKQMIIDYLKSEQQKSLSVKTELQLELKNGK